MDIVVYGSFFNQDIRPTQQLQIIQSPSTMRAGNQSYFVQPKVALVNTGGEAEVTLNHEAMDTVAV